MHRFAIYRAICKQCRARLRLPRYGPDEAGIHTTASPTSRCFCFFRAGHFRCPLWLARTGLGRVTRCRSGRQAVRGDRTAAWQAVLRQVGGHRTRTPRAVCATASAWTWWATQENEAVGAGWHGCSIALAMLDGHGDDQCGWLRGARHSMLVVRSSCLVPRASSLALRPLQASWEAVAGMRPELLSEPDGGAVS